MKMHLNASLTVIFVNFILIAFAFASESPLSMWEINELMRKIFRNVQISSFDVERQQVIDIPFQNDLEPKYTTDHYQQRFEQPSNGYAFNKQFPHDNSSASNTININFLPAIVVPIERYLPEKSHQQQDHAPKDVMPSEMEMDKESSKSTSDVRADNAPINIKNLG